MLANFASGDARSALNTLDLVVKTSKGSPITTDLIKTALSKSHLHYDKDGEEHYNILSALHKSMRGNDANAALYWMGRMLLSGEDPRYVTRRLIRFASEDIGLADPQALVQAVAAHDAASMIGMPECSVNIVQSVAYLSNAPKSNALYTAWQAISDDIQNLPNEPVPIHLHNAPMKLMKDLGYGKGSSGNFLPERVMKRKYL